MLCFHGVHVLFPRSLCVDALIELSDENADWKLSFDEFLNCLKPGFNPPEKSEPRDKLLNKIPPESQQTYESDGFKGAYSS